MSRTVFILGAGASKEAGAPLMADIIDKAERLRHQVMDEDSHAFDLVFRGLAELRIVHSKAVLDIDNLESVFAAFEMAALFGSLGTMTPDETRRLADATRRVIARTLELPMEFTDKAVLSPTVGYQKLAKLIASLGGGDGAVSVMTFNYDMALEVALAAEKIRADYRLLPLPVPDSLGVMKLHGSLNWAQCKHCKGVRPWVLEDFFVKPGTRRLPGGPPSRAVIPIASTPRMDLCCGKTDWQGPVIVPPTWNKTQHYGEIAPVWQHASKELTDAERIVVVGYSLPPTDQFFRYLYALGTTAPTRLKLFAVCDPDISDSFRQRFEGILGQAAKQRFKRLTVTHPPSTRTSPTLTT